MSNGGFELVWSRYDYYKYFNILEKRKNVCYKLIKF